MRPVVRDSRQKPKDADVVNSVAGSVQQHRTRRRGESEHMECIHKGSKDPNAHKNEIVIRWTLRAAGLYNKQMDYRTNSVVNA